MKLKFFIPLVLMLSLHVRLIGQTEVTALPKVPFQKAIGVNISGLFNKIARIESDSSFANPYLFTASLRRNQRGYSIALGGAYSQLLDQQAGFADFRKITNANLSSRISMDFYPNFGQKWTSIFSIDGIFGLNSFRDFNETGIDLVDVQNATTTFGLGPRMQLQYSLTKHLSLGMETFVHLRYQIVQSYRDFRNFQGLNDQKTSIKSIKTQPILPLALFINLQL